MLLPQSLAIQWGYGAEDGGSYVDHQLVPGRWIAIALSLPLLVMVGRLFIAKYGRTRKPSSSGYRSRFRFALPSFLSRVPIPLPGRFAAVIWLELRQAVPLAACGLLFALLMTVLGVLFSSQLNHPYSFGTSVLMDLPGSMFSLGMLWAVVVGSGLYSADLSPGLGTFWRSRPISVGMWFWTKFLIGLAAVLGVLDGTTILVSWNAPRLDMSSGMSWSYVGCFPIIHALCIRWRCSERAGSAGRWWGVFSPSSDIPC